MTEILKKLFYGNDRARVDYKELQIIALGIFLLFYGTFAMTFVIFKSSPSEMFWICYVNMFFSGLATLRKNGFIIAGFLNISLIPLIFWDIDFLFSLITGEPFLGITDFFFEPTVPAARFISVSHFFLLPVMLYLLYLIKLGRKDSWKLSFFILVALTVVSLVFSSPTNNVNCIFDSCVSLLGGPYYQIKWLLTLFGITTVTALVINRFPIFFVQKSLDKKSR